MPHPPHGIALEGYEVVQHKTGERLALQPVSVFCITSAPHDRWVEGEYVSLHVLNA